MRNYVAIAPRGTCGDPHASAMPTAGGKRPTPSNKPKSRIFDCVEIAQRRFNIHAERIFLAGVGCGGTMALRTAWNHPGRFAGVATFGGPTAVATTARCATSTRCASCPASSPPAAQPRLSGSRRLPRPAAAARRRLHGRPAPVSLRRRPHHHHARGPQPLDHGLRLPAASIAGKVE